MSVKTCINCGARVNSRARRCADCKRIFRAKNAREKYHSTSTRLPDDYQEAPAGLGGEVVNYSQGGSPLPGMVPLSSSGRQNPNHDHVTRLARQRAQQAAEGADPEMSDWDRVVAHQADYGALVAFEAPSWSPASGAGGFYRSTEARPVDFPDVAGELYTPRPAVSNGRNGHLVRDLMPWR